MRPGPKKLSRRFGLIGITVGLASVVALGPILALPATAILGLAGLIAGNIADNIRDAIPQRPLYTRP